MIECPVCGHEKSKIEQTLNIRGHYQRYRVCSNCGSGFNTREYSTHALRKLHTDIQEHTLDYALKMFGGRK